MCQLNTDPMRSQKGYIEVQGTFPVILCPMQLVQKCMSIWIATKGTRQKTTSEMYVAPMTF